MNRRCFLAAAGGAAASALGVTARGAGMAVVSPARTISVDETQYHGWPTLARRANGELALAYSGGREAHVCPFGRVEWMTSRDEGERWTWPRILLDSAIDDRDAGVVETPKGTLLVTTFTPLAYEPLLTAAMSAPAGSPGAWAPDRLARWRAAHERLPADRRRAELGQWILRSTDGGATWSARAATPVNSPHGPVALRDGRLLYAGQQLWTEERRVGVCESLDDGVTWRWLADIPPPKGDRVDPYHELHAVEAADGTILVHIRNHNTANRLETLQSESTDGGRTWSAPHPIGVWGLPSFLQRLRDGRLLMTYGHRRPPFGVQARWSADGGHRWSEPLIIYADGANGDLGYPSTVELEGGDLLTVWYEQLAGHPRAALRQARWRWRA